MSAAEKSNGLEGKFVLRQNKKLAWGYTTGSCAAAAAKAAASMLLTRRRVEQVDLMTPKGILLHLTVKNAAIGETHAECAIQKDAGDDPDVTDGLLIYARASFEPSGNQPVIIEGGTGVGKVTKPGLEQPVGSAAINRVPREMITEAVGEVCQAGGCDTPLRIEISVPQGESVARKTFNPRLGILGGISILGTSGIVEPMSETALLASIRLEMQMRRRNGADYLVMAPGNYGARYLAGHLPFDLEDAVKFSNFVGEAVDYALELEYKGILFVSHIGKFIKVAGGIMNTHSRSADSRMEILAANALRAGAGFETLKRILDAVTTDECLAILQEEDMIGPTMERVLERIQFYLENRAFHQLEMGVILFSNEYGELGRTKQAELLMEKLTPEHVLK